MKNDLEKLHQSYTKKFEKIPRKNRKVVTTHAAFAYLDRSFDIEFQSALGWTSNSDPSAKSMARLLGKIQSENIRCFFGEDRISSKLISMLAKDSGLQINGELLSDNLSKKYAPHYQEFMKYNLDALLNCLMRDPRK